MLLGVASAASQNEYRINLVTHRHMNGTVSMAVVRKGLSSYFDSEFIGDVGSLRFDALVTEAEDGSYILVNEAAIIRGNRRYPVRFIGTIPEVSEGEYLDNVDICVTTESGEYYGMAVVYFTPKRVGHAFVSLTIGELGDKNGIGVLAFGNNDKRINELISGKSNEDREADGSATVSSTIGTMELTTHPEIDYVYVQDAKSWVLTDNNYGDVHFTDTPALVLNVYSLEPAMHSGDSGWVMGRLWSNTVGVADAFTSIDGSEVTCFVDEARVKFYSGSFAGFAKSYPVVNSSDEGMLSWASWIMSSINNPICQIVANAIDAYRLIDFGTISDTIDTTTTFEKRFVMPDNIDLDPSVPDSDLYREEYGGLSVDVMYDECIISGTRQITVTGRIDYYVYIGYYISVRAERSTTFDADFSFPQ